MNRLRDYEITNRNLRRDEPTGTRPQTARPSRSSPALIFRLGADICRPYRLATRHGGGRGESCGPSSIQHKVKTSTNCNQKCCSAQFMRRFDVPGAPPSNHLIITFLAHARARRRHRRRVITGFNAARNSGWRS